MRILVIGHDASRTGAPLALLWWLRWMQEQGELAGELWLRRGGPLVAEYAELLPVRVLEAEKPGFLERWLRRARVHALARRMFGLRKTAGDT